MSLTKICGVCKTDKPLDNFAFKNIERGEKDYMCKPCRVAYSRKYYQKNIGTVKYRTMIRNQALRCEERRDEICLKLLRYLSDKCCAMCGHKDIRVLEFDHIDPKTKKNTISNLLYMEMKWETAAEEMKKCQILCSNCHSIKTSTEQGHRKIRLAKQVQGY